MTTKAEDRDATLVVERHFAAPRERIFRAWTDPQMLLAWFRPGPEGRTTSAELDLRTNGKYRIAMEGPESQTVTISGTYQEIVAPKKLTFTWKREGIDAQETLVSVEFHERDGGTQIVLTHARFGDKMTRDRHEQGWQGSLRNLAQQLTAEAKHG